MVDTSMPDDVLLMSRDVIKGINEIYNAFDDGIVTEKRLSVSVKKTTTSQFLTDDLITLSPP